MASKPDKAQVLIIGGGPGGSYSAACLAREGVDVVILESARFPRYHIGESMLPSIRNFLRYIDLEDTFVAHGFYKKKGAAFRLHSSKPEGYTNFVALDENNYAWNTVRSESDEIMLSHAATCGAMVFQETRVTDIEFDAGGQRPVAALWKDSQNRSGRIQFNYLIDASGRRGLLSTKYFGTRQPIQSLKNIAMWSYWCDTGTYKPDSERAGSPFFEALGDGSGWAWFIPLHGNKTSVGVVMKSEIWSKNKSTFPSQNSLLEFYLAALKGAPEVKSLIGAGGMINITPNGGTPVVMTASDYSYSASSYAGENYRIVGDAGAFVDPFFSNGIHLAVSGGLSAAATICASIKGDCSEAEAAHFHTRRIGTSYTRFLVVVLSAYQQMRAQSSPVLADIDEDSFDRAFNHFRPIIQGYADVQSDSVKCALTEEELKATLEFCAQAYIPPEPENKSAKAQVNLVGIMATSETLDALSRASIDGRRIRLDQGALGLESF
ncbi:FAD/NAD(P)-binding domain-containing protein [Mycena maculata]|uniref:FAD/NAD(P)-binding domain-containing protein n=1 Tax=Mycena maculata TaxID=230809 RepID=A0AAD7K8U9_9AGAR|nr:FAD/NAD(P)-binding domain-containing protein [Mycena maculata]